MDDRQLVISICASVSRLQRRTFGAALDTKLVGELGKQRHDCYRVGEMSPPSAWLEGVRAELAVVHVSQTAAAVLAALLEMLESDQLDRSRICALVQGLAVGATAWTRATRRLAKRWDLQLPAWPAELPVKLPSPPVFRRVD